MKRFLSTLLFLIIGMYSFCQGFAPSAPDFSEENILLDSLRTKSIKKCIVKEEYFIEQYGDYYRKNLKHRSDTFAWQLESSKYIFWLVLLVVVSGLLFSGIQFFLAMRSSGIEKRLHEKIKGGGPAEGEPLIERSDITQLEMTMHGVKIKTSIIGLAILVISIAFLFLYLKFVYPINEVNLDQKVFTDTTGSFLDSKYMPSVDSTLKK